MKDTCTN